MEDIPQKINVTRAKIIFNKCYILNKVSISKLLQHKRNKTCWNTYYWKMINFGHSALDYLSKTAQPNMF